MNYQLIAAVLIVLIIVVAVAYNNVPDGMDLTAPSLPGVFKPPVVSSTTPTTSAPTAPASAPSPAKSDATSSEPVRTPDPPPSPALPYEEQETPVASAPNSPAPPSTQVPTQTYIPVVTPVMNAISNYRKVLNAEFYGFDLPNGGSYGVATEEQCASKCNSRPDCAFFSYRAADGGCWLKTPTPETQNSITGIKRGDGTYVLYPKTDVFGNDIANHPGFTNAQCEQRCTESAQCDMYHTINNNNCWIKAAAPKQGVDAYFRKSVYN